MCSFANEPPGFQAPCLWWPEDESWFVISEFDYSWTYVAGSERLIDTIETSPDLEALRSSYDHSGLFDSDGINPP